MNALHTRHAIDWVAQIKLALVLSAVCVIAAMGLVGRVSEPTLVVGTIVIASAVAWARIEPVAQPARVHVRRR